MCNNLFYIKLISNNSFLIQLEKIIFKWFSFAISSKKLISKILSIHQNILTIQLNDKNTQHIEIISLFKN